MRRFFLRRFFVLLEEATVSSRLPSIYAANRNGSGVNWTRRRRGCAGGKQATEPRAAEHLAFPVTPLLGGRLHTGEKGDKMTFRAGGMLVMLNRIKKWIGITSAALTGVVLVLVSTGVADPGSAPADACQAACENYLAKCNSGSSSSSSSGSSGSSSSSSSSGSALTACVDSCRGTSSSSSSSSSSSAPLSSSSSSSSGFSDAYLLCIANAPTCAAMYLCGTGSGSSGSGSSGSGDVGMDGLPVGASPEVGAGIGGAGGASVVVPGTGGAGGASVTAPVAASGGIGGLAAVGTGGVTILASDPAVGVGTGGTIGAFSSAPTSTGPGTGTPTAGLSKSGGCQLGHGGSGSGLGILLGLAYLLVRRRRTG